MATWEEIKNHIIKKYPVFDAHNDGCYFYTERWTDDDRILEAAISKTMKIKDGVSDIWIEIESPVGEMGYFEVECACEYLASDCVCGGLVKKRGDEYFVRHTMPIKNMSLGALDKCWSIIINAADEIKKRYLGDE